MLTLSIIIILTIKIMIILIITVVVKIIYYFKYLYKLSHVIIHLHNKKLCKVCKQNYTFNNKK